MDLPEPALRAVPAADRRARGLDNDHLASLPAGPVVRRHGFSLSAVRRPVADEGDRRGGGGQPGEAGDQDGGMQGTGEPVGEATPLVMIVPVMLAPSVPPTWRNMLTAALAMPPSWWGTLTTAV